jgi:hypothetical protein
MVILLTNEMWTPNPISRVRILLELKAADAGRTSMNARALETHEYAVADTGPLR